MKNVLFAAGARRLVEVNGRVKPEESVVIITDYTMLSFAEAVASAVSAHGAKPVMCIIQTRHRDGQEPPAPVAAAMLHADVLFCPVSISITHTKAMRAALQNGARAVLMTAYNDHLMTSAALLETDFEKQAIECHKIGDAFKKGKEVHLTSPAGTDLKFSIVNQPTNVLTNIPEPGQLAPVPDIEVNVVPVTGSAEGLLIADASFPYLGIGVLDEPVICTIEKGYITKIEGGKQAKQILEAMERPGDRNCFNVAELGVGLNPNAKMCGLMLEDEGVLNTIHIGVGTSHTLGGDIVAPTHYDLIMWNPKIVVDGRTILEGKKIYG